MTRVLLIINGPAYGSDETFNAVRLAIALADRDDVEPTVFLMGDAVSCAVGTCLDARGLTPDRLIGEAGRSTMPELASWTVEADRVLTF